MIKMFGRFYIAMNDGRLLSPCCDAPQNVYPGPIEGTPEEWVHVILHQCSKCGRDFDPEKGRTP